jgi:DNA polymerase III delta prime subunit
MKSADPFNNLSHHAYLLVGDSVTRDELLFLLEKKYGITSVGNSDFYTRNYETFTIDDSRELKVLHSSRPVGEDQVGGNKKVPRVEVSRKVDTLNISEKKIFVLTTNGITAEAQNALLKLFEEPAEYAHFFLIIPSAHVLIPTMKSRMSEVQISITKNNQIPHTYFDQARLFLNATQSKKLEIVKKIAEDISKDLPAGRQGKVSKQDAIYFLNELQQLIYVEKGSKEGKSQLEAIEIARNYLNDRAPSVKMLLEYVALSM